MRPIGRTCTALFFSQISRSMSRVYRITKSLDIGDTLDSIESVEAFARDHGPGRYDVDEHWPRPVPRDKGLGQGVGKGDPSQGQPCRPRPNSLASVTAAPARQREGIASEFHICSRRSRLESEILTSVASASQT